MVEISDNNVTLRLVCWRKHENLGSKVPDQMPLSRVVILFYAELFLTANLGNNSHYSCFVIILVVHYVAWNLVSIWAPRL